MNNHPLMSNASALAIALPRGLRRLTLRIHRDEQGNLGVLLLMTILALVLLIAMVWNTAEATTRRAYVQNAADATAHASATWMTRTTNLVSATNMLLGENASSEVILRSVQPTIDDVAKTLTGEEQRWKKRMVGDIPGKGEINIPDFEAFDEVFGTGAWAGNAKGTQLLATLASINTDVNAIMPQLNPFLSAGQKNFINTNITLRIPRNQMALQYVQGVWIDGGAPGNANFPQPPSFGGGTGLRNIFGNWIADLRTRYQVMLDALPAQWAIWQQFVDQTAPAMGVDPAILADRRAKMYEYEQQIVGLTPTAAEEQRAKLAAFYKCQINAADPVNGPAQGSGEAAVQAPVFEASIPEPMAHDDTIRPMYPDDAIKRFGTADPGISIDAINVHMDDAALWHPGAYVTKSLISGGPSHTYHVLGGEWGAIQCAPLARYINGRVARDEDGLAKILRQLDQIRAGVRAQIFPPPWVPNPVAGLPKQLVLDASLPPNTLPLPPEPIGKLPKPAKTPGAVQVAIDAVNAKITQYNKDVSDYIKKVQGMYTNDPTQGLSWLENLAIAVWTEIDGGTQNFAEANWDSHVEHFRFIVLKGIGANKGFMVLKSYKLDHIPEWAKDGVHDTAYTLVYNDVLWRSYGSIGMSAGWPYAWNSHLTGWGVLWQVYNDLMKDFIAQGLTPGQAAAKASAMAPGLAQGICITGSVIIATETSAEWIRRPWPYEITPQVDPTVPASEGWRTVDRPKFFTYLTAAANTDANKMNFTIPKLMGAPPKKIAAFAQSEAFNWMEFNGAYGAGDHYDSITDYGHNVFSGSPSPWRASTIGGWTWQPRLALSDQLAPAMALNPEMKQILSDAGVPNPDPDSLKTLIMH